MIILELVWSNLKLLLFAKGLFAKGIVATKLFASVNKCWVSIMLETNIMEKVRKSDNF